MAACGGKSGAMDSADELAVLIPVAVGGSVVGRSTEHALLGEFRGGWSGGIGAACLAV